LEWEEVQYSTHTAHTVLIHCTHCAHTLHTLCSYTTHTVLIHYTHYAHTLHTLCSYTTQELFSTGGMFEEPEEAVGYTGGTQNLSEDGGSAAGNQSVASSGSGGSCGRSTGVEGDGLGVVGGSSPRRSMSQGTALYSYCTVLLLLLSIDESRCSKNIVVEYSR
jgi:hypothetical protein